MPDILQLDTPDWELVVWTKHTEKAATRLRQTLAVRGKTPPATLMRFSPDLLITAEDQAFSEFPVAETPLFFENKQYEFDFRFYRGRCDSASPVIRHRLQLVEDAFHYSERSQSLRGSINFGNDVGWFRLRLAYTLNGKPTEQSLSFEVMPSKMDLHSDLDQIQQTIDQQYPLWRFALSNKTETELERSQKPHERFPLLWLAQFESLRYELQDGIRQIVNAPHSRLLSHTEYCRADRLKGRLHPRQAEKIKTDLKQGIVHRRYLRQKRQLSVDTPENRFIKSVLQRCVRDLTRFSERAAAANTPPENSRLSDSFFQELNSWKVPLQKQLNQPFFRELGVFSGLSGESLVLHQKSGYSKVYRVWQQLRMYLDVLGRHASVSVKSVAELYEVWCFLEVRGLLTDSLGFREKPARKVQLKKSGLEFSLYDGIGAAFEFERDDGITVRLAHEPVINRVRDNLRQGILSWTTVQKPDILLDVTLPDNQRLCWVFDAKYRIHDGSDGVDLPPDDALNQMHRYRDAMIYADSQNAATHTKSRPVYAAFVLYPGWFTDQNERANPLQHAIDAVGIGAFPLLPGQYCVWLQQFLEQQLGSIPAAEETAAYPVQGSDRYFVQEAGRISYSGMQSVRYHDLTLVASLGGKRSAAYIEGFRNGTAQWYHIPVDTTEKKRAAHFIMQELRYCALAVHVEGTHRREVLYTYPVLSVERRKRSGISEEQTGTTAIRSPDSEYWLLRLGKPFSQNIRVSVPGARDFKFLLTGLNALATAAQWSDLPRHYALTEEAGNG